MWTRLLCLAVLTAGFTILPAASSNAKELVRYQLKTWKAIHVHDEKKVKELVDTFKKLRVEVQTHTHGDHSDVRYRCPKWQELTSSSHEIAHKWEKWLQGYGFKTEHKH